MIRPADLDGDRADLIALLSRNLPRLTDDRTFDWLYRENPHGPARVWVAAEPRSGALLGAAAAFPRRLRVGSHVATGWVLGDFCVDAGYRTLGPALALQRACLRAVDAGDAVCTYDFPSQAMTAVYRRLGLGSFGSMVRLVRILRADRILKRTLPAAPAAVVSAPFNRLLSLHRPMRLSPGMEAMLLDAECGEEFSDLARRAGPTHGVCVERDADYLRWRYQRNPLVRAEFLALRRHGELLAYAVIAVLLVVDSPGGGVTASDELWNEVKKVGAKKKVIVHMGNLCASGGYYVSAPAHHIVASPTSVTGSIGVIMSLMDLSVLMQEKLGIKENNIKSGPFKDIGSMGRPMKPEERAIMQAVVDDMYARFVKIVADGRAGKGPIPSDAKAAEDAVRAIADGRIYTATQALANGLVDEIGYLEDAQKAARRIAGVSDAEIIRYRRRLSFMDLLAGEAEGRLNVNTGVQVDAGSLLPSGPQFLYLWAPGQ